MPKRLLPFVLLLISGCATVGKDIPGVANFDTVEPSVLYRGAQPSEEGIATLRDRGVKTIINLRNDPVAWEPSAVRDAGLTYVHIPASPADANMDVVTKFLAATATSPRPIYVHCMAGKDRTGLAVAVWRMNNQSLPRDQAIADLHAHGYNWFLYPGVEKFLRAYTPPTNQP